MHAQHANRRAAGTRPRRSCLIIYGPFVRWHHRRKHCSVPRCTARRRVDVEYELDFKVSFSLSPRRASRSSFTVIRQVVGTACINLCTRVRRTPQTRRKHASMQCIASGLHLSAACPRVWSTASWPQADSLKRTLSCTPGTCCVSVCYDT